MKNTKMKKPKRIIYHYNPQLKTRSRRLRKNMTEAEIILWNHIRRKQINGVQFFRQRPIGNYIVDFYAPESKLVIEVDGGQHFEDEGIKYDKARDAYLKGLNLKVLRVSNLDVLNNMEGIVERIIELVK